jgi:hypothetical protein
MMIYNDYLFYIIHIFILFIKIDGSIKSYKFEQQIGSMIILPPCLSTLSSFTENVTVRKCLFFLSMINIYIFLKFFLCRQFYLNQIQVNY